MSASASGTDDRGTEISSVTDMFGGPKVLKRKITSPIDAHEMLIVGLPATAVVTFLERVGAGAWSSSIEGAIGFSKRTLQRRKGSAENLLTPEQSGRAWKFAEVFAKASEVFGSEDEAKRWLSEPAMALDQRRPIDLLASPAGTELVENLLLQLEYGVYV